MNLLPHISFAIMLALSRRSAHGYQIKNLIELDSSGAITCGAGALYSAIKRLQIDNLIEEIPRHSQSDRRRCYRLTKKGWNRLKNDTAYYQKIVELTKQRPVSFF